MKRNLLALTLAVGALFTPAHSHAEAEVSFEYFYDNLSPYGAWVQVADYGICWHPNDVDEDWAPYTDGYWSYTDAGWTWISYEDFGDITYHYGRWIRTDDLGWCWVPDTDWGPAWVSWRSNDDYVGWAPLPPEAHWRQDTGFSTWVDDYCDIGPAYYTFCPVVEFGAPVIRPVCVPRWNVVNIFATTVNITNISFNFYRNLPFCGGPNFAFISSHCRRPVPALKLVQNTTIINNNTTIINNRTGFRGQRSTVAGNTLNVFAPKIIKNAGNLIKPPQVSKVVAKDKVHRGWNIVKDPTEAKQLRAKVKAQSQGLNPETAPAKAVQVADLKPLPEKADPQAPSPVQRQLNPKFDRNHDGIPDSQQRNPIVNQPPGATPSRVNRDKNGDGRPDAPITGPTESRPGHPEQFGKPSRPEVPPNRPFVERRPETQPSAPVVGTAEPTQPTPTDPNRGLRRPFNATPVERPVANQSPTQPAVQPPVREPGVGADRGKRDQQERLQLQRQQEQRENVQRQQAVETQRQQAIEAQREQPAARQQAIETQRQQQAAREQAIQAQRDQQAARQQALQEQAARQQAIQEQAARQQQAMEEQCQRQAERQQRALDAQREMQAQRQQQMQQQQAEQQRQQQQSTQNGGRGRGNQQGSDDDDKRRRGGNF
jgi:hypothetical protein